MASPFQRGFIRSSFGTPGRQTVLGASGVDGLTVRQQFGLGYYSSQERQRKLQATASFNKQYAGRQSRAAAMYASHPGGNSSAGNGYRVGSYGYRPGAGVGIAQSNADSRARLGQSITGTLNSFRGTVRDSLGGFGAAVNKTLGGFQKTVGNSLAGFQRGVERTTTGFRREVDKTLTGFQRSVDKTLTGFQRSVDKTLTGFQRSVDKTLTGFQRSVDKTLTGFQKEVAKTLDAGRHAFDDSRANLGRMTAKDTATGKWRDTGDSLSDTIAKTLKGFDSSVTKTLTGFQKDVATTLDAAEHAFDASGANLGQHTAQNTLTKTWRRTDEGRVREGANVQPGLGSGLMAGHGGHMLKHSLHMSALAIRSPFPIAGL